MSASRLTTRQEAAGRTPEGDELLALANRLFTAWADGERLPAVSRAQARRTWGAGFLAGLEVRAELENKGGLDG